jgi:crossover junction endodeoxyribonuclease RuvC
MTICGIDPGLTMTGVALYDTKTCKFLDIYAIGGPKGMDLWGKCRTISDGVYGYVQMYKPDLLAIESNYVANAGSALKQAKLIGFIAARWQGKIVEVAPTSGKKALTGSGKAGKGDMVDAAMEHMMIADLNKQCREAVADAMGVCLAAAEGLK